MHAERHPASVVQSLVNGIGHIAGLRVRRMALAAGLGLAAGALAADPSVVFDVQPRVLGVGETAMATIEIRNLPDAATPTLPDLPGFQVQAAGQENRVNIVNGARDDFVVHRYALTATREGEHVVGPFRYEAGGRMFPLPAVKLRVAASGAVPAGGAAADDLTKAAFAAVTVDPGEVYVHERFTITISLYHRGVELDRSVELMSMPQSGLKLGQFSELGGGREVVGGEIYEVRSFRAEGRALTAGEISIAPTLRAGRIVRQTGRARTRHLFEDFIGGGMFDRAERRPLDLAAEPVKLLVRPLPAEGRPESFSGAVGSCEWEVGVRPTELAEGDPVTVTMAIRGDANLEAVNAPRFDLGPSFRVYDPKLVSKGDNPREKVFEQVVIPRDERVKEIPALAFSFFDPQARAYRTVTRGPFPLVVRPSTNGSTVLRLGPAASAGPLILEGEPDIVYLKPVRGLPGRTELAPWAFTWPGALVHGLPAAVALAAFLAARRREALAGDVARARRERAPKAARPALRKARLAAERGDGAAFHDALWESLTTYFGNRLNLAPGEVDRVRVVDAFAKAGMNAGSLDEIGRLFDACDMARYAGAAAGAAGMRDRVESLVRVLARCERARL